MSRTEAPARPRRWSGLATARRRRPRARHVAVALTLTAAGACSAGGDHAVVRAPWAAGAALPIGDASRAEVTEALAPAAAGQPWLAVGLAHQGDHDRQPRWWRSADAETWTPGGLLPRTADGPASGFLGVARVGGTVVAVGEAYSAIHGNARPLAWVGDGTGPLAEVPVNRELFGGPRAVGLAGVAASSASFVVAGDYIVGGTWTGPGARLSAAVWRSTTGSSWQRVEAPVLAGSPDEVVVGKSVAVTPGGVAVLAGDASPVRPGNSAGGLWRSPDDGGTWVRVGGTAADMPADRYVQLSIVRWSSATGFVAVGVATANGRDEVWAWHSRDGTRWRHAVLGRPGSGAVKVLDAAPVGGRMLVLWAAGGVPGLASVGRDGGVTTEPAEGLPTALRAGVLVAGDGRAVVLASSGATPEVYAAPLR